MPDHVLTLTCADRMGIVRAVSGFLAERQCNIVDSQQFGDAATSTFFMRVHFVAVHRDVTLAELQRDFGAVADEFAMTWQLHDSTVRSRMLIMVSRLGHCLNDLLYRCSVGALHADIVAVVANHPDFEALTKAYDRPFHHVPVTPQTRSEQEAAVLRLVDHYQADVVVLARYMQVLSDDVCTRLSGRIINIHHSFLPSFKGGRPYHQAHALGVKLVGATAHYVTADLDEGPIIEQDVVRVDHSLDPAQLAAVGRDVEAQVLARAVQWHAQHRVLLAGAKTVVFR